MEFKRPKDYRTVLSLERLKSREERIEQGWREITGYFYIPAFVGNGNKIHLARVAYWMSPEGEWVLSYAHVSCGSARWTGQGRSPIMVLGQDPSSTVNLDGITCSKCEKNWRS